MYSKPGEGTLSSESLTFTSADNLASLADPAASASQTSVGAPAEQGTATAVFAEALRPGGLLLVHVPERDWRPVLRSSEATTGRGVDRPDKTLLRVTARIQRAP